MTSPPPGPTGSTVSLLRSLSVASHLPLPVSENCRSCLSLLQLLPVNTACHPTSPCYLPEMPVISSVTTVCLFYLSWPPALLFSSVSTCWLVFWCYYLCFYFYVSSSVLDLMFKFLFSFLLFFDSFPTFFIFFFETWNTPSLFVVDNYVKPFFPW
jgi:hypothetical protein